MTIDHGCGLDQDYRFYDLPAVGVICQPHSENCTALREDGRVNLRWALTYDHEAHSVLTPLFCNTPHGGGSRTAMFLAQIRMRFFEHEHQWALTTAFGQIPCQKRAS